MIVSANEYVSVNEYVSGNVQPETNPERIKAIGMVISLDFIFCSGLHNLERSRGRKIFDSKEGQAGATVMVFASNLRVLSSPIPKPRWSKSHTRIVAAIYLLCHEDFKQEAELSEYHLVKSRAK